MAETFTTLNTVGNDFTGRAAVRYPADLGTPPFEKWMLFEVKEGRHIGRTGVIGAASGVDRTLKSVALYLPPEALNSTLTVSWQEDEYGTTAGAMVDAATQTGSESSKAGTQNTPDSGIAKLMNTVGNVIFAGAKAKVGQALQTTLSDISGGLASQQLQNTLLGAIPNPRTDVLFKGISYREHNLSFTLVPRNLQEAQSIDEILNTFQYYMLPSFGDETGSSSMFIGYPYEFTISMFTQHVGSKNQHINTIDRSVLTSCSINHISGSRVAFINERNQTEYFPASTTLTLAFKEVRLQGRNQQSSIWRGTQNKKPDAETYPDTRSTPQLPSLSSK